jgi:glycerophosphoryl diester phosphodiesterase
LKLPRKIYSSRTTNGTGEVSQQTLAELKKLDAGEGQTIPTLAEAIACCQAHELGLYLELKSSAAIPAVIELIRQHHLYPEVIVTSFQHDWLATLKALDANIVTSVLFGSVDADPVALAQAVGALYVHPAWERRAAEPHRLLTPEWISQVRTAALGLICWHEERPSEIAALRQLGVDGICSNAPELLL